MKFTLSVILTGLFSANAFAGIADWKETQGITEKQAEHMADEAIDNFLSSSQDGESCSVDEIWGLEREKDLNPDRPQRGEIFALTAYASGPDEGCSITRNFDCRVVFNKLPGATEWKVEYTDCEPTNTGGGQ
jgi:hypothetical protein